MDSGSIAEEVKAAGGADKVRGTYRFSFLKRFGVAIKTRIRFPKQKTLGPDAAMSKSCQNAKILPFRNGNESHRCCRSCSC